mgnify:CR=1 FL=1
MGYQLKEVADRIRTLREIAGYSQEEMAEKAVFQFTLDGVVRRSLTLPSLIPGSFVLYE